MRRELRHWAAGTAAAMVMGVTAAGPCRAAEDIQVNVGIDKMLCLHPTETGLNNRDEIYMIVKTNTSGGGHSTERLPAKDDYYEFWQGTRGEVRGWTDKDQRKQGSPILYKGNLAHGETVHVLVAIAEQDNKDLASIVRALTKIAEIAVTAVSSAFDSPEVGAAVDGALEKVAGAIQENKDDVIGTFAVLLRNDHGRLQTRWMPGKYAMEDGHNTGFFHCRGTSKSAYDVWGHVDFKDVAPGTSLPKRRIYLGTEIDQCGENSLKVQSTTGSVEVHKGETLGVHVPAPRFWWYCANSQEWTTAPDGTNYVVVHRDPTSRQITWYCYREE